ncbi:hypothetical protein [Gorillibacterium sp. sgz5001074]|uniref:hypothetical protein n=1 Tax=Gorillibacterium sp. sgz5001074 TaxID=3446695 RepID=UPI003F663F69
MKQTMLWALLVVPWASLFLLRMDTVRRYMPVALCMTIIHTLAYQAAYHYGWWDETSSSLFGWDKIVPIPWVYGAYLAIVIWVFHFTFGKLWLYLMVNILLDGVFMYLVYPIWQRMGLVSSESTLPTIAVVAMMVGFSILIYLYQMWQQVVFKEQKETFTNDTKWNGRSLHWKRKAK